MCTFEKSIRANNNKLAMRAIIFGSKVQPRDVTIGIDQFSFEVKAGNPFCGVKNIPDGIHVIHFSSSDEETECVRYGYWFEETKGRYLQFDQTSGAYSMLKESDDTKYDTMIEMHSHLMVSYPKIEDTNWSELTSCITYEQIQTFTSNEIPYVDSSMTTQEESRVLDGKLKNRDNQQSAPHFDYTNIQFKSHDAIRDTHRMEDYMDKSHYLNHVIVARSYKGHINRLLGELQFAFCNALLFGNYGSSLQWHSIVELVTFSTQVSTNLIKRLDSILALQLETLPDEYCATLINQEMWLRCLTVSHMSSKLPRTKRVYDNKFNSTSSDEDSESDHHLPNIDSDEDEDEPTVVSGVYYVRS